MKEAWPKQFLNTEKWNYTKIPFFWVEIIFFGAGVLYSPRWGQANHGGWFGGRFFDLQNRAGWHTHFGIY